MCLSAMPCMQSVRCRLLAQSDKLARVFEDTVMAVVTAEGSLVKCCDVHIGAIHFSSWQCHLTIRKPLWKTI